MKPGSKSGSSSSFRIHETKAGSIPMPYPAEKAPHGLNGRGGIKKSGRRLLLLPLIAALAAAGGCSSVAELATHVSAGGFKPAPDSAPSQSPEPSSGLAASPGPGPSNSPGPSAGNPAPSASPAPSQGNPAPSTSPTPSAGNPAPSSSPAPSAGNPGPSSSPAPSPGSPAPSSSPAPSASPAPSPSDPAPSSSPAPSVGNLAPSASPAPSPAAGSTGLAKPSDGRGHAKKLAKGTKAIALTFDDGPDSRKTPAILDILKKHKVPATFFVVGEQVKQYPDVVRRIVGEGHALGNHTYHHADLAKSGRTKILHEIEYNDTLIQRAVGFTPTLFRPPYGSLNHEVRGIVEDSGRSMVLWNIDTRDWAGTSVSSMRANIKRHAKPGSIILMHSFGSKLKTVELLPLIIKDLKKQGYTFVTADQLPEA